MLHVVVKFLYADKYAVKENGFSLCHHCEDIFSFPQALNGEYSLSQYFKKSDCIQDILPSRNCEVFLHYFVCMSLCVFMHVFFF